MLSLDDTIAAVSTPIGEGGIGIVRMSGPAAPAVLARLFRTAPDIDGQDGQAVPTAVARLAPFRLRHGYIVDPETAAPVDEVLAVFMPAPRTYTRQEVVEIDCHGGYVAVQRVLALCLAGGARLAEPGEFTLRAFLSGRLDLAQAEAVVDVVRARTDRALQTALGQLAGHLSRRLEPLRARLLDALAYVEASIDFEADLIGTRRDLAADLHQVAAGLESVLAGAERGLIYRQGVRVAIAGRPNAGKSSLLNCLLRTGRAIVTDIPGTTRDTVEETSNLQGVPLVLIDTAGLAEDPADPIEKLGVERSREALLQAGLVLVVLDASLPAAEAGCRPGDGCDPPLASLLPGVPQGAWGRPFIAVLNKIDLLPPGARPGWAPAGAVPVSALTGAGIDVLEQAMVDAILCGGAAASDVPLVSNPRHQAALRQALDQVRAAQATWQAGLPVDLLAVDLAAAVRTLGEVTGQTASDDLLDTIFGTFCIGK